MSTVYFAHGQESGPWGTKIQTLAQIAQAHGLQVESPNYAGMNDPDARVQKLLDLQPADPSGLILVGSSMGAYVATVASQTLKPAGLFLMAPAFYRPGYAHQNPTPHASLTVIVQGLQDTVIPPETSLRFAREHQTELHLIHGDHRLNDQILTIASLFEDFLRRALVLAHTSSG
jgi:alpha/beta superfamily hydrolase